MVSSPLFAPFSEEEQFHLAENFEFLEIEPNSILVQRGQRPIGMYVLLTGEAHLTGASDAGTLRKLGPGDIFGEQALLNNAPSQIDVRTQTKCFALCLPADEFPQIIMTHPTVLEYLSNLNESAKGELDVTADFLDHITFF
jgi:CRP-like cAMP-binding protein